MEEHQNQSEQFHETNFSCRKMIAKICILAAVVALANGHGYLMDPLSRTSVHMNPGFPYVPPYWWDHQGVWCGNVNQDMQYSTCGRCGDAPGENTANQHGIYDKKFITGTYQSGALIEVKMEFGALHYGQFHLELCPQQTETDNCFQRLPIVEASLEGQGSLQVRDGNRVCMPYDGSTTRFVTAKAWLPAGIRCERCTLRWTYRTDYPGRPDWDMCDNPNPTQTFRNCADIKIQ